MASYSFSGHWICYYLCVSRLLPLVSANSPTPVSAKWATATFGPDGPWPAVEVLIGQDQKINLFPGRQFQTFVITTDYCSLNSSMPCYASQAGLYNEAEATLAGSGSTAQIQWAPNPDYMLGVDVRGSKVKSWVDYIDLQTGPTIPNVTMALLEKDFMVYPDGTYYPLAAGCLGIGAPKTINQTFTMNGDTPAVNASLIPGYLSTHDSGISSNSFAMHIGSAQPSMAGSLWWGGYDQNRVIGDILTTLGDYYGPITLKDVGIEVFDGTSPWNFTTQDGLLAIGNKSLSNGVPVKLDGCSPYLTLPKSTCDGLASQLPVTYMPKLGLYSWNTNDAKYTQIVSSASALTFTFLGGSNTKNMTINVPFRHLNLTLQAPLVSSPTSYFPCYAGPSESFTLGRAFLQDAFVGANWGQNVWWLAQAPGPNIQLSPNVIEITDTLTTIQASTNDWKESWSGFWTALTPAQVSSSASVSAPGSSPTDTPAPPTGSSASTLSTGAKAGIGVGAGVGGLAVLGFLGALLLRYRRNQKSEGSHVPTEMQGNSATSPSHTYGSVNHQSHDGSTINGSTMQGTPTQNMMYGQQVPTHGYYEPPKQDPHMMQMGTQQMYSHELPGDRSTFSPSEMPGSERY